MLAKKILNLVSTVDGTMRSIRGPCTWEPDRGAGYPLSGRPHGMWQGTLLGGVDDTILVRVGGTLYRYAGWARGTETLHSGLTNETSPRFPDRFVQLSNKVIWTNGIDRALVVSHDGMTVPLGFDDTPAPPQIQGPRQPSTTGTSSFYPNAHGFSWPGRIGTPGDQLAGQTGALLAGEWIYYLLPEDVHGNLGAASRPSNPALIHAIQADPYDASSGSYNEHGFELDDLMRQFRVIGNGDHNDPHCVAWRLYRTPDARNVGNVPQLVARFPGRRKINFNDALSDAELGSIMPDLVPVPVFHCMCVHQGSLVIANMLGDPGLLRKSDAGFPGMFQRTAFTYPDAGGGEITGVASHGGRLLAFTESAVYDCSDFSNPQSISEGVGCVAPSSLVAHPSGQLIWLSRDGFYAMSPGGQPQKISGLNDDLISFEIARTRMHLAVAEINPVSQEYVCFLAPAGSSSNTLGLVYDGSTFKRWSFGIDVTGCARTRDGSDMLLLLGRDSTESLTSIFVVDHETGDYTAAGKVEALFQSANMYGDEIGLHEVHVYELFVGMVDACDGTATVRFYRNGESTPNSTQTLRLLGADGAVDAFTQSTIYRDVASRGLLGTAQVHDSRLTWRRIPVNIRRATSWRFEISVAYPAEIEIAAFAFTISTTTDGHDLSNLPGKDDA